TIINNFKQFKMKLSEIEKIIISHGHLDHYGGLIPIIPELKEGCEIYLSPICFNKSYYVHTKSGEELSSKDFGTSLKDLKKEGKVKYYRRTPLNRNIVYNRAIENNVEIIETSKPEKLCEGTILSGEIQIFNETELPKGLYLAKNKMEYEKHTYREEIALYINVKDKGLVIITGCSHTGIINIIKHGQKITGINKIYALIGGFHKERDKSENIEKIVSFIEDLNPEITCGMHCTGFEFNRLMSRHPSHVIGVIGTEFHL
ncbi:MAG: MBL fold metallo-hydrolase, partial [Candidatus Hodarchaeota archaeon]